MSQLCNKPTKPYVISAVMGLSILALSACSSAPARDADTYYDLRPEINDVSFGSEKALKIQSVSVKGLQSGRSLIFEKDTNPVQYQEVRGHLWHVSPSDLIETSISDALMTASQDLVIGTSDTIDNEDLRLRIVVTKFHFTPNDTAKLAFDAVIKDKRGKIISSTRYDLAEPIAGNGYDGAVLAIQTALEKALGELVLDIQEIL